MNYYDGPTAEQHHERQLMEHDRNLEALPRWAERENLSPNTCVEHATQLLLHAAERAQELEIPTCFPHIRNELREALAAILWATGLEAIEPKRPDWIVDPDRTDDGGEDWDV